MGLPRETPVMSMSSNAQFKFHQWWNKSGLSNDSLSSLLQAERGTQCLAPFFQEGAVDPLPVTF